MRADLGDVDALAALEQMNARAEKTVRDDDGYVQDRASQWVSELVDAQPGELVADVCAAPGGKATAIASTGAHVIAGDLHPARAALIAGERVVDRGRERRAPAPLRPRSFDRVLVDAPCSGLGALRRRPDARWRITEDDVERLTALQRELVDAAVTLLRPDGVLVYSVCTLTKAESIGIDDHLAAQHPTMEPLDAPGEPWRPWGRGGLLLPQAEGTDGMAILRVRSAPDG